MIRLITKQLGSMILSAAVLCIAMEASTMISIWRQRRGW